MNVQHLSKNDDWITPRYIIDCVHQVLGNIDLDPASSPVANEIVKASNIHVEGDDGLNISWSGNTVYLNPPGGKTGNQSNTALWWKALMQYRDSNPKFAHAIFMGFSLECLQNTQNKGCLPVASFPFCVPARRIRFLDPTGQERKAPSHSNIIAYIPGSQDYTEFFQSAFSEIGFVKA